MFVLLTLQDGERELRREDDIDRVEERGDGKGWVYLKGGGIRIVEDFEETLFAFGIELDDDIEDEEE